MSILGHIKIKSFLEKTHGEVRGKVITDAKDRVYLADYDWQERSDGFLQIVRRDGTGDAVIIKPEIELDESLVSFFGLYSGDGAKGSESPRNPGIIVPSISFSQREPNLVKFAVEQFKKLFSHRIHFNFSLGEDSAYFMDEPGAPMLQEYYGGTIPAYAELSQIRPALNSADKRYLEEKRNVDGTNEEHLAFYYTHKAAMETLLSDLKKADLEKSGLVLDSADSVTASLRRPFKKGARQPGGSSRSDEIYVGGLNRFGEFFLKILHEIEDSIYQDSQVSAQGLIHWLDKPSDIGESIDIRQFFATHSFGQLAGIRPRIQEEGAQLKGQWPRSKQLVLKHTVRIDPLFCYVSGLYLAEGSTPKSAIFGMFGHKVSGFSLGFTSTEDFSIDFVLRSLRKLFREKDCLSSWKIKVGSQYFPELVVIGLKNGVPMLRGGQSGDGKLRTMEISTALKEWALEVAPSLSPFKDKYSHVEPTGAGVARIDFSASSSLCKWYFPLIMYATFGNSVTNPPETFLYG